MGVLGLEDPRKTTSPPALNRHRYKVVGGSPRQKMSKKDRSGAGQLFWGEFLKGKKKGKPTGGGHTVRGAMVRRKAILGKKTGF